MSDVIQVEHPIGAKRLTNAFAFNNELLATAMRVRLVLVPKNPLEIGALLFTRYARYVIRVRLIVAF
jgi:hypothetical protein